ncbi:MAG: trimeric intracellular cation channel family protein [Terriglobales bacterium]|jgi:uncharacterized membrane protein YeiH
MTLPNFPQLDMFSAGINALYGVLVAGQPSHNRNYTLAGLLIMAFFGGIGGGVTRDVLLNDIPGPFRDPYYLLCCILMGLVGLAIYRYAATREERFRTRTLAFFKSFSLPWFAILGAHKALEHGLNPWSAILIGVIATNAGGVLIDVLSGVTPDLVKPSEQLVTASVLAGAVYTGLWELTKGMGFFPVTLIAVAVTFVFRIFAVREHFPSIVPIACPPEGPGVLPVGGPDRRG